MFVLQALTRVHVIPPDQAAHCLKLPAPATLLLPLPCCCANCDLYMCNSSPLRLYAAHRCSLRGFLRADSLFHFVHHQATAINCTRFACRLEGENSTFSHNTAVAQLSASRMCINLNTRNALSNYANGAHFPRIPFG